MKKQLTAEQKLRKIIREEILKEEGENNMSQSIEEFWKSVDFAPLQNAVSKAIGLSVKLSFDYTQRKDEYFKVFVKSPELVAKAGIFQSVVKSVRVEQFNSEMKQRNGYWYIWLVVVLAYEHHGGGTNGSEILDGRYNIDGSGKWDIRIAKK